MGKFYVFPHISIDIAPSADHRSVERVTACCMDVNAKGACMAKMRGGAAWWLIWMTMVCVVFSLSVMVFAENSAGAFSAGMTVIVITVAAFGATLYIWPLRVWRTHLPLRFNRRNRKVYFHWKGRTYIEDWDTLRAYLTIQRGITGTGAPVRDPQINIEFLQDNGKYLTVFLMGHDLDGVPLEHKAAVFWEYIRRYMEDGPEGLPDPQYRPGEEPATPDQLRAQFRITRIWEPGASFLNKVINLLVIFPISMVWIAITYPTELIFYYLTRNIRTDPFPPEMEEPCRCDGEPAQRGSE